MTTLKMPGSPDSASAIGPLDYTLPVKRGVIKAMSKDRPRSLDTGPMPPRPRPLQSVTASAQRITASTLKNRRGFGKPEEWQSDAWDMYDLVGEQRFLATTLAGRLGQAYIYAGKVSDSATDEPEVLTEGPAYEAVESLAHTNAGKAQMLVRMAINLFVAGDGYFVGIPHWLMPHNRDRPDAPDTRTTGIIPQGMTLDDFEWRTMSVDEVKFTGGNDDEVTLQFDEDQSLTVHADSLVLVRVWRGHPRESWKADSPTRSSLPVLRELVALTEHVSAQVDSRLAGAGLLVVAQSITQALRTAANLSEDDDSDPLLDTLMETMMTAISDRSSAAAYVPITLTVPDEAVDKIKHITFSSPLDAEARSLRDEAIRRLALGQDAPPELLLGVGGMNHWGAWLVREDVITTHIEPPLALICDALTTQFLWPLLEEQGMTRAEARQYVVWYSTKHLVQRPNRGGDAVTLYNAHEISGDVLRESTGFDESDAPSPRERAEMIALRMVSSNPALLQEPGLAAIIDSIEDGLMGRRTGTITVPDTEPQDSAEPPTPPSRPADGPPENDPTP